MREKRVETRLQEEKGGKRREEVVSCKRERGRAERRESSEKERERAGMESPHITTLTKK
jgi:hypothetical protein